MKRYRVHDWVDYIRGFGSKDQRAAMAELVASGDAESARQVQFAASISSAKAFLTGPGVPENVVAAAKAAFEATGSDPVFLLPLLRAALLIDTAAEPQPAGYRPGVADDRETLFQAEGVEVSVRIHNEPGTALSVLIGQVKPPPVFRPVLIFRNSKLIARTLTNEEGEFQLEFSGKPPLKVVVHLDRPERRLELDLAPSRHLRRTHDGLGAPPPSD